MNKHISRLCLAAFAALSLSACGNFFDESSQDEIKPSTVEDLRATFFSEGYPYNASFDNYLFLLTDEAQSNGLTNNSYADASKAGQPVFCFDPAMFDGNVSFVNDENSWKNYYKLVMGCNVALDYIDGMTGTEAEKLEVKGQARLLRAYYFLKLATIYCQPYSNNPDMNLGVTLITSSSVKDAYPSRSTVRQTYDFIERELKQAKEELKNYVPTTKYRVTSEVADILLSRLYLYEEKWDECIAASDEAIKNGPQLTNFNSLYRQDPNVYTVDGSSEVVWNYSGRIYGSPYLPSEMMASAVPYSLNSNLLKLYDATNDLRYNKYINNYTSFIFVLKTPSYSQYDGEHGVRMAEPYLNRAEAYARKAVAGDAASSAKAVDDLNTLRYSRYATGTYTNLADTMPAQQLLQFVLDERQREFLWEDGFRWMDIKRNHLSVTHTYIDDNGGSHVYTLKADDPLYALPIPAEAVLRNPNLEQNPR